MGCGHVNIDKEGDVRGALTGQASCSAHDRSGCSRCVPGSGGSAPGNQRVTSLGNPR